MADTGKQKRTGTTASEKAGLYLTYGIVAGMMVGIVVGAFVDRVSFGIGIGMFVGALVSAIFIARIKESEKKSPLQD